MLNDLKQLFDPICAHCQKLTRHQASPLCRECLEWLNALPIEVNTTVLDFPIYSLFGLFRPGYDVLRSWKKRPRNTWNPYFNSRLEQIFSQTDLAQHIKSSSVLVPIPHTFARLMQLGTSPSGQIAELVRIRLGAKIVRLLDPPKTTYSTGRGIVPQARRSWLERQMNSDQFEINSDCLKQTRNAHVILVDDIVTTGNTLKRAAYALRCQGFQVELAVAAGSRPDRISAVSCAKTEVS
jgi:predicted amidophosphoribosyltransferase